MGAPAWAFAPTASRPELEALFLLQFTNYVEWDVKEGPFVIGVLGPTRLTPVLKEVAKGRTVGDQAIEIRVWQTLDQLTPCHILFISAPFAEQLPVVLARVQNKQVLTVGDTEGFGDKGVAINFYQDGRNVRFEANRTTLLSSGLSVSSQMLKLARFVD